MRRVGLTLSFIGAQVLTYVAIVGPISGQGWLSGFRNYFSNDQLSYAAIATNVSHGHFAFVEPFTQTNSLYYPSLWYQLLGLFSKLTGIPVYTAWNVLGTLAVCALVGGLGIIAFLLSRKAWAPLAPAIALFVGTLSTLTSAYWYTSLDHHAVLWGPFGTFFTLNAETIGLCLNGIALGLLAYTGYQRSGTDRGQLWLLLAAGALIGLTANIQTYNFFTGVAIVATWACVYTLVSTRSKPLVSVTVALLALMLIFGRPIADRIGHIPTFGLLLIALAPGAFVLARRHLKPALAFLLPLMILAAPQVLRTALGLAEKDPFLTYRQGSTEDLGVPLQHGLLAGLPVLLVAATCVMALILSNRQWLTSAILGTALAWMLMSLNDVWGFSQEPYRLWIQGLILTALLCFTLLPLAVSDGFRASRMRTPFVVLLVLAIATVLISFLDFPGFWRFAHEQGVSPLNDSRSRAIEAAVHDQSGLIVAGPCIDPQLLKLVSGNRVAFENKGLAWAENREPIQSLMLETQAHSLSLTTLLESGSTALVTDSACDWTISGMPNARVTPEVVETYSTSRGDQTITRWRINAN